MTTAKLVKKVSWLCELQISGDLYDPDNYLILADEFKRVVHELLILLNEPVSIRRSEDVVILMNTLDGNPWSIPSWDVPGSYEINTLDAKSVFDDGYYDLLPRAVRNRSLVQLQGNTPFEPKPAMILVRFYLDAPAEDSDPFTL